jgi:hypothetical protein
VSAITLPATAFTENYTLTGGTSANTNCRLLDNTQTPLTSYSACSGSINYNTPSIAGAYGYYVQANKSSTGETVISNKFTVTVNPALVTSCSDGANNPPACNTCSSPLIWNGSACVSSPPPPPSVTCSTLDANPTDIDIGSSVALTWVCSATCPAISNSDGFSTGNKASGSDTATTTKTGSVTYGMTCGGSTFYFPPVTVESPQVSISATPTRVIPGGSTSVSWTSSGVTSCTVSRNGALWETGTSSPGVVDANLSGQVTYLLSCNTATGPSATDSVIVDVNADYSEF